MECMLKFIEKVKIDLTVRFTKHLTLSHYGIMDNIFKNVEGFFDESVKSAAHYEFETNKEYREYYAQQDKLAAR